MKVLVFDTETTDKPPVLPGTNWNERTAFDSKLLDANDLDNENSAWNQVLSTWPSIIQLSYILYDTDNPSNAKIFDKYIEIGDNIVIAPGAASVHHIDIEKINSSPANKKAKIEDALKEFMSDIYTSDIVVGHNVQFDRKMVISEMLKLNNPEMKKDIQYLMDNSKFECTMNSTTNECKLQMPIKYIDKKTGKEKVFYKIKSPKLSESYQHYFGYAPMGEALHDALVDVVVCLRVFMKYKYNVDVCGKNEVITKYIIMISPPGYACPTIEIDNSIIEIVDPITENISVITDPLPKKIKLNETGGSSKSRRNSKKNRSKRNKK
jgi:DNA polymerase III epsilon subunit-like protein